MAKEPQQVLEFRDFGGLQTDADIHDQEKGIAIDQVNVTCADIGMLQTRGGVRLVSFETTGIL